MKHYFHLFNKCLLNDDFVLGTGLGAANTEVNKSLNSQAYVLVREACKEQMNKWVTYIGYGMVTSDVGKIQLVAVGAGRKLPGEGMAGSGLGFWRSFCLQVENPRDIRGKGRGGRRQEVTAMFRQKETPPRLEGRAERRRFCVFLRSGQQHFGAC